MKKNKQTHYRIDMQVSSANNLKMLDMKVKGKKRVKLYSRIIKKVYRNMHNTIADNTCIIDVDIIIDDQIGCYGY